MSQGTVEFNAWELAKLDLIGKCAIMDLYWMEWPFVPGDISVTTYVH